MLNFVGCCAEVEELAALIYREIADQMSGKPELGELMRAMSRDEEDHARQLRFATRVSPMQAFEGVNNQAGDPFALKSRAEKLLAQVKAGLSNEEEALKIAVDLENNFRSIHAGYALIFKDAHMKKMFEALARADRLHLDGLNKYLQTFKQSNSSS